MSCLLTFFASSFNLRIWVLISALEQEKLETVTGIPAQNQVISLYRNEDDPQPIRALDDDSRPLGYYSIINLQTLKVGCPVV